MFFRSIVLLTAVGAAACTAKRGDDGPLRPSSTELRLDAVTTPDSEPAPERAKSCSAAEHRGFDFWIGTWNVFDSTGAQVGTNVIESQLDGCLIHESWRGASGSRGRSLNVYDPARRQWIQRWVSASGQLLRLAGDRRGNEIVLSGIRSTPKGTVEDRISWSSVGADVRQRWELIRSDSATPILLFDGLYTRGGAPVDTAASSGSDAGPACESADAAALEGRWIVADSTGRRLGTSVIDIDLNGCLIEERFTAPDGHRAIAFTGFDRAEQQWHRVSIDSRGRLIEMRVTPPGSTFTAAGLRTTATGETDPIRMRWESKAAGTMIVRWERSADGGTTWRTTAMQHYSRDAAGQ